MNIKNYCAVGFAAVCGVASVACSSESLSPEAEAEAAKNEGAVVLFESQYSSTGSLVVVRDDAGQIGYGVKGRIGADDRTAVDAAMSKATLAETYTALHAGLSAPAELTELSQEFKRQRDAALALVDPKELVLDEAALPQISKSQSDFNNSACVLIGGGFEGYSPSYCTYQYNWHSLCTYNTIGTNDRSFGWNETPYSSKHSLSGMSWKPAIPAWTFYWHEWGGSYSNRYSCITLDGSGTYGNLGITHHNFFTDTQYNPVDH